jgi:formamidopyrimidine-DNA glycosylase
MIEAPEARLLCEQLNKTVCGKRITDVFAQYTPHKFAWFYGKPEECAERLVGKTIDKACPQGGMVELTAGDTMLVLTIHVGYLSHNILFLPKNESDMNNSGSIYRSCFRHIHG